MSKAIKILEKEAQVTKERILKHKRIIELDEVDLLDLEDAIVILEEELSERAIKKTIERGLDSTEIDITKTIPDILEKVLDKATEVESNINQDEVELPNICKSLNEVHGTLRYDNEIKEELDDIDSNIIDINRKPRVPSDESKPAKVKQKEYKTPTTEYTNKNFGDIMSDLYSYTRLNNEKYKKAMLINLEVDDTTDLDKFLVAIIILHASMPFSVSLIENIVVSMIGEVSNDLRVYALSVLKTICGEDHSELFIKNNRAWYNESSYSTIVTDYLMKVRPLLERETMYYLEPLNYDKTKTIELSDLLEGIDKALPLLKK